MDKATNNLEQSEEDEFQEFMDNPSWKFDPERPSWRHTQPQFAAEVEIVHLPDSRYQPLPRGLDGLPDYEIGQFDTLDEAKTAAWIYLKDVETAL